MPWRLASPWGDSPPRNSWTTWRLNSIECVRCLAMGFLLESPVQLADSQVRHLSTPRGALQSGVKFGRRLTRTGVINQIRGFLIERAITVRQGVMLLGKPLPDI